MSEVRAAQRQASDAVAGRLDSLSAASKQLERQTDDLARERPRPAEGQGEKSGESLSFEEAKKAESVAQSQQELMRQAESLKQSLEALQKSAEAAGLGDSAWQRELSEIRDQLERALSPELRERLAGAAAGAEGPRRRADQGGARAPGRGAAGDCARRSSGVASCSSGPRSRAISRT